MRMRPLLAELSLLAVLVSPGSAWAVATLTGTLMSTTGQPVPNATITLEREDDEGQRGTPVVLTTDATGRFRGEVPPGVYTLRSTPQGLRVTDTVVARDGETTQIGIGPSINPEYPGPGNLTVGVGYWGMWRPLELDGGTAILPDGTRQPVETVFGAREFNLDLNVGFIQATYGLPRLGGVVGNGFLSFEISPYARLGGGVATVDSSGGGTSFKKDSGPSLFAGGGINTRIAHTSWPVYTLVNLQGYYMDFGDVSGSGGQVRDASGEGSLYGFGALIGVGAQLNRLAPGLTGYAGMLNFYAGIGGSWVFVNTEIESSTEVCVTRPGPRLGPFPDSPRGPDVTECSGSRARIEKDLVEKSAVHGLLGVAFPIWGRDTGVVEASIGDGWWGVMVKLAKTFGW